MEEEKSAVIQSPPQSYFGIWIPQEDEAVSSDKSCVVPDTDRKKFAEILKRNSHARFVKCGTEEEAWASLDENSSCASTPSFSATVEESPLLSTPKKEEENGGGDGSTPGGRRRRGRLSFPALNTLSLSDAESKNSPKAATGEEKNTQFSTPRTQELSAMAREINMKNNGAVIARIEANPKMLVNDCDLPTTVHEGCRYNALHIAAKCDNYEIIGYILNKVGSKEFMRLLYPNKSAEGIREQNRHVTNAYLNTPDKFANETPIFFATKFLSPRAAEVLVRHPLCALDTVNCCQQTAKDIIAERAASSSPEYKEKKTSMQKLFSDTHIVPIWRDGCNMPVLGPVADIRQLGDKIPKSLLKYFPDLDLEILPPCFKQLVPEPKISSVRLFDFDNGKWEIKAFAGPATKESAERLLRSGKGTESPNRSLLNNSPSLNDSGGGSFLLPKTPRKGKSMGGSFIIGSPSFDFSPMRKSLRSPFSPLEELRVKDVDKGMERHIMKLCNSEEISWNEEWAPLNFYGDIKSKEGLGVLEEQLKKQLPLESPFKQENDLREEEEDDDEDNQEDFDKFVDAADQSIYMKGTKYPMKLDFQLYSAISDHEDLIDFDEFPLVFQWFNTMKVSWHFKDGRSKYVPNLF